MLKSSVTYHTIRYDTIPYDTIPTYDTIPYLLTDDVKLDFFTIINLHSYQDTNEDFKSWITLGISSCPSDKPDVALGKEKDKASPGALTEMQNKALEWASSAKNSHLRPRDIHFSIQRKFWPKVKYGLCANTSSYDSLVQAMHKPYHTICPLAGVIRSAKRELRYLDTGFFGVGLPHWGIEGIVEMVNKVLVHFGSQSLLGVQLQMSAEILAIEVGMSASPLLLDFEKYGSWATQCTWKELWARLHRFGFKMNLNNINMTPPREHDGWFMAAVVRLGYGKEECKILNRVRLHQQVVFESDVFGADGRHLDERYLRKRPATEQWSNWLFGKQHIPPGHFNLWKHALLQIAPNRRRAQQLGDFLTEGHKIWQWRFDPEDNVLLQSPGVEGEFIKFDKSPELSLRRDKFIPGPTVYPTHPTLACSARVAEDGSAQILSTISLDLIDSSPTDFLDVLEEWGCTWMWREMKITNSVGSGLDIELTVTDGGRWLYQAIEERSLVGVTDGSFIRELCPTISSAALIMECTKGRGRLVVAFSEHCLQANAYRGELLGLMALHLILLSINRIKPDLEGAIQIYSDCLGALHKVEHLPPHKIPSNCRHSDVLKNILINCSSLSFKRIFSHVSAHQDDLKQWEELTRPEQLNCACDQAAKQAILSSAINGADTQQAFPLEPITFFIENNKITSGAGDPIRYATQMQEAKVLFDKLNVVEEEHFDSIAWDNVHQTLHSVPKMFQIFLCKQVFGVSAMNSYLHKRGASPCGSAICQSCTLEPETSSHILRCPEEGIVQMLNQYAEELLDWLDDVGTPRDMTYLIVSFIKARGERSMTDISWNLPDRYKRIAMAQDNIGWRIFLEGMIVKEFRLVVEEVGLRENNRWTASKWTQQLILKLQEITHGMWIYRNLSIHDPSKEVLAVQRRESLLEEIEKQIELGGEGLAEEDKWMLEVNLGDLDEGSTGIYETYWLMAIETARARYNLRESNRPPPAAPASTETGDY